MGFLEVFLDGNMDASASFFESQASPSITSALWCWPSAGTFLLTTLSQQPLPFITWRIWHRLLKPVSGVLEWERGRTTEDWQLLPNPLFCFPSHLVNCGHQSRGAWLARFLCLTMYSVWLAIIVLGPQPKRRLKKLQGRFTKNSVQLGSDLDTVVTWRWWVLNTLLHKMRTWRPRDAKHFSNSSQNCFVTELAVNYLWSLVGNHPRSSQFHANDRKL